MSRNSLTTERTLNTMWKSSDKKQEPEERRVALDSHKLLKKRPKKPASSRQATDAAISERQGPSITVTPATPQPRSAGETRPSTSGSERTLTADSPVLMLSPYRTNKEGSFPRVTFSKDLLIRMDHNKYHLEIDLFRPASESNVFPLQDLSPLCLYRELRTLKITGMMQSYQSYIWLAVWLNPQLTDLALEMAGEAEPLDVDAIAKAQQYAKCKPTMLQSAQGKTTTEVLKKFHIANLSLTNFVVQDAPFQWFSDMKLQKVELHRCKDAGFELPSVMERSFNIIVTA